MFPSTMQRSGVGSYSCWSRLSTGVCRSSGLLGRASSRALLRRQGRRCFTTAKRLSSQESLDKNTLDIRQRLRLWEIENDGLGPPFAVLPDLGEPGKIQNVLTNVLESDESILELQQANQEPGQSSPGNVSQLDYLPPPSDYKPGDLVEIVENNCGMVLLAVCLGHYSGLYHFYTAEGKWLPMQRITSPFVINNFASQQELQPVIDKLPKEELPQETLWTMSKMRQGPDREAGATLLRKMLAFQEQARTVTLKNITQFQNPHKSLVSTDQRFLTLKEIASVLIDGGRAPYPPHALYAVHRSIMSDDVGFRLLGSLGRTNTWVFGITSLVDATLIHNIQTSVRSLTDIPGTVDHPLSALTASDLQKSALGPFILKAREAIDQSRRYREWTPHGALGPTKQPKPLFPSPWQEADMRILRFMHLWVGYDHFSLASTYHWIGSAILRTTGRYKESDYLSPTTGWTFLQEVGYLTPWDIRARYSRPLPGVEVSREKGYELLQLGQDGINPHLSPDIFDGKRKEWKNHRVFAIDSTDTSDIDDAVSIESTEIAGEHWVHIHVADPASRIRPDSALADRAKLVPLTLYLPGHHSNIWGVKDEIQKLLSLGPDQPCLTFSGKVNNDGELLEYKITPAKVHDFVFMTPEEVNKAVGFQDTRRPPAWSTTDVFQVGKWPNELHEGRKMTTASDLRPEDLDSLKALHRVATSIHKRRLAQGAMPVFPLRPEVKVSFDDTSVIQASSDIMLCNGEPSIRISWNQGGEAPLVTNTMTLAGEIAGRWCADRGLAIPYISQPKVKKNVELAKSYAKDVYYPPMLRGESPTGDQITQFRALIGWDEVSTIPGPHFVMGVDCYAKVTSPLRRYSDLLAHWQIESALVQEAETGKVDAAKVPLDAAKLDKEVIPWMQFRQTVINRLGNSDGRVAYMCQALLRAWKFPSEGDSKLPETFRFRVSKVKSADSRAVSGTLDWFDFKVRMVTDQSEEGVSVTDIKKDDVFEVRLKDINVHLCQVDVEAVAKIGMQTADGEIAAAAKE